VRARLSLYSRSMLTATGPPHEALAPLDYVNYDASDPYDRGDREVAKAFACRRLESETDAEQAIANCLEPNKHRIGILDALPRPERVSAEG
jgi:hypothetical protein